MVRAFLILGAALDVLLALFLLVVSGWVVDSWRDPNGAWVGVVVTTIWLIAFLLSAGRRLSAGGSIAAGHLLRGLRSPSGCRPSSSSESR